MIEQIYKLLYLDSVGFDFLCKENIQNPESLSNFENMFKLYLLFSDKLKINETYITYEHNIFDYEEKEKNFRFDRQDIKSFKMALTKAMHFLLLVKEQKI